MASDYRNNDVQRVIDATDIVRLIGEYVTLRPAGREYKGLCPFHDDTRPSMSVVPHKGIFHCFACGTGGSAIRFVQLHQHVEFREALRFLAERAGIELTPWRPARGGGGEGEQATEHEVETLSTGQIVEAHQQALGFYRLLLRHERHGALAREIFAKRGISNAMIERFELGTAPTDPNIWDGLARTLAGRGLDLAPFAAVGLLSPRREGDGFVDRFRNRLIFPIHDEHGRPIAFGARKIDPDDEPKYLNSPEHPRFKKSRTLYGLHLARTAIQKSRTAAIVEGYTDVIACHQRGVENVVATLGTALTADHARMLARLCNRVVLVFDGDAAGQRAADRAVEVFFQSPVDVRIAVLPGGLDPAELLEQEGGLDTWMACMEHAVDALDFLFAALRAQLNSASAGVSSRQRLIEAFLSRLGLLGFHHMTPLRRDLVLSRVGEILHLPCETLARSIPRPRRRMEEAERASAPAEAEGGQTGGPAAAPRRVEAEMRIAACLLIEPALLEAVDASGNPVRSLIESAEFVSPLPRSIVGLVLAAAAQGRVLRPGVPAEIDAECSGEAARWMATVYCETGDDQEKIIAHLVRSMSTLRECTSREDYERLSEGGGIEADPESARARLASIVAHHREAERNLSGLTRVPRTLRLAVKGQAIAPASGEP